MKAGMKALRDGRAAHDLAALEHQSLQSRFGKIGGRHQTIVATADDDDVVLLAQ